MMHDMTDPRDRRHDMTNDTSEGDLTPDMTRHAKPDVLLQVEAADVAGVSVRTLQRAIDRGALAAQRVEGKCWIRRDDLLAWSAMRHAPERHDTSSHATTETTRHASDTTVEGDDARVARLERALADTLLERDRWHEAWRQAEARRIAEADALRDLLALAQQTALARMQAIEAGSTVQPDTAVDANEGPGEAMPAATTDDAVRQDASRWGRFWRALTGR
jgi:excisionase family DNA binding protein